MEAILTTRQARIELSNAYMGEMSTLANSNYWMPVINWCDREMVMHSLNIAKSLFETANRVHSDLVCRPYSEPIEELMVEAIRNLLICSRNNSDAMSQ